MVLVLYEDEYKHKIGDVVTVRSDIDADKYYYMEDGSACDSFGHGMYYYCGKPVTISGYSNGKYLIKEDGGFYGYYWTDEMFVDKD